MKNLILLCCLSATLGFSALMAVVSMAVGAPPANQANSGNPTRMPTEVRKTGKDCPVLA